MRHFQRFSNNVRTGSVVREVKSKCVNAHTVHRKNPRFLANIHNDPLPCPPKPRVAQNHLQLCTYITHQKEVHTGCPNKFGIRYITFFYKYVVLVSKIVSQYFLLTAQKQCSTTAYGPHLRSTNFSCSILLNQQLLTTYRVSQQVWYTIRYVFYEYVFLVSKIVFESFFANC